MIRSSFDEILASYLKSFSLLLYFRISRKFARKSFAFHFDLNPLFDLGFLALPLRAFVRMGCLSLCLTEVELNGASNREQEFRSQLKCAPSML